MRHLSSNLLSLCISLLSDTWQRMFGTIFHMVKENKAGGKNGSNMLRLRKHKSVYVLG